MPIFCYSHPKTKEIREIVQSVHDEHIYIDEKGVKWLREFTVPQANVSPVSKIDPFNKKQFSDVTATKKGTFGEMFDLSAELSQKREKSAGRDEVKEKMYSDYSKKRNGKKVHPQKRKEVAEKLLSKPIELKIK